MYTMGETGAENEELNSDDVIEILLSEPIALATTNRWKSFGRILGVKELTINEIEESRCRYNWDYVTVFKRLFSDWRLLESRNVNLTNLINKLEELEWNEVIDQLRIKYPLSRKSASSRGSFEIFTTGPLPIYYTEFLKSSHKILLITTPSCEITIRRFMDVPNTIGYSTKQFLRITSMSKIDCYKKENIPVVNCEDDSFTALKGAAKLAGNKTVFVTSEIVNKIEQNLATYKIDIASAKIVSDIIVWNDLTPTCQHKIETIANRKFKLERGLFQCFMNVDDDKTPLLLNILKSITPNGTTSLPSETFQNASTSVMHISRSFVQNHVVSEDIFKSCNDGFYFLDTQKSDLPDCLRSGRILNDSQHFHCETENTSPSLHLMMWDDKGWKWLATRGNVHIIREHILHNEENNIISQDNICTLPQNHIFAISDKSGIGKTSLFQNMLKENRQCVFVDLPKFIQLLKQHCENNKNAKFIEVLKLAVFEQFWSRQITTESLENIEDEGDFEVHVFLDDYEKLDGANEDTAKKLFNEAQNLSPSIRFYVAGRSYVREQLETCLNALTVELRPFQLSEQIEHLFQIWRQDKKDEVHNLKDSVTHFIKSLNDEVGDIISFPLHCTLIGKMYRQVQKNPNAIKVLETLLKEKFELYKKYSEHNNINYSHISEWHMKLGIVETFPNISENDCDCKEEILKFGIIETLQPQVKFIHKSFANYFAALWIMKCLQSPIVSNDNSEFSGKQNLIMSNAFETHLVDSESGNKTFRHKQLCRILNEILDPIKNNVDCKDMFTNLRRHLSCGENFIIDAVSACIRDNFEFLFKLFTHSEHFQRFQFDLDLLLLSIHWCSVEFVEDISRRYKMSDSPLAESIDVKLIEKILEIAAKRGDFYVFKYLAVHEKLLDNVRRPLPFNIWFENSIDENADIIEGKVQIIRFLGRRWSKIMSSLDSKSNNISGNTIHKDITVELLSIGTSRLVL